MAHVFISYAHVDAVFAEILRGKIENAGFDVWIDTNHARAGEDWREEIDSAIQNSFALIVIMTPKAKESEYVTYEWAYSLGVGVKVIPILIKPFNNSVWKQIIGKSDRLHPQIENLQYINFIHGSNWDQVVQRLKEIAHKERLIHWLPRKSPENIRLMLVGLIETSDANERMSYLKMLCGRLETEPEIPILLTNALRSSHKDIVAKAAWSLGEMNYGNAMEQITDLLKYEDESMVLAHAASALGRCKYAPARENLIKLLEDKRSFHSLEGKAYGSLTVSMCAEFALKHIDEI